MYGSARLRTFYGAGDYGRALALSQAYGGGYYAAGGFFSKLKKLAAPALGMVGKLASNPLVSAGLSFIPGGGLIGKGVGMASKLLASPVTKAIAKGAGLAAAGGVGAGVAGHLLAGSGGGGGGGPVRRRRRSAGPRRSSSSRRSGGGRRRRRRAAGAGDYGDDWPGRAKATGWYLTKKGGRRHGVPGPRVNPPHRKRRRSGGGRRVSFRTKSGEVVSFTAR